MHSSQASGLEISNAGTGSGIIGSLSCHQNAWVTIIDGLSSADPQYEAALQGDISVVEWW
jgi:hypothetical protein